MNKTFETVTRVTIIGPEPELHEAIKWCEENSFKILRQGPMPVMSDMKQSLNQAGPMFDNSKFKIFAETKAAK